MHSGELIGRLCLFLEAAPAATDEVNNTLSDRLGQSTIQLIVGIVLLFLVFYIIYIVYKHFLSGKPFRKGNNMKILEVTSVGPGSTIQLIKVAEEYFLIGVTKTQITFLTMVDNEPLDDEGQLNNKVVLPFEKHLSRFFRAKQTSDSEVDTIETPRDENKPAD